MISAFIALFSFLFRNILPKRFFIFGSKSFRLTQDEWDLKKGAPEIALQKMMMLEASTYEGDTTHLVDE